MASTRHLGLLPYCVSSIQPFNKEQVAEIHWRIREWEVVDATGSVTLPPVGTKLVRVGFDLPQTEKDLVCVGDHSYSASFGDPPPGDFSLLTVQNLSGVFNINYGSTSIGGDSSATTGTTPLAGTVTLQLLSGSVSWNIYNEFEFQDGTLSVVLAPSLFWAYDPGDGLGPVYDTLTGAQLRDPHAV